MAKKSILSLENTLYELGYYPEHIKSYIQTINQILQRGLATVDRRSGMISAAEILQQENVTINRSPEMVGVPDILQQETETIKRRLGMVCAARIRPLFKINRKSIDVFLITSEECNLLRILHPSNPFCKGESDAGCYAGNQKWLAGNIWDKEKGSEKGFYFT